MHDYYNEEKVILFFDSQHFWVKKILGILELDLLEFENSRSRSRIDFFYSSHSTSTYILKNFATGAGALQKWNRKVNKVIG